MKSLPDEVAKTLSENPEGLVLPARFEDGHGLASVTFYSLKEVKEVVVYVEVDEYIDNYSDTSHELAGNYYPIPAIDLLRDVPGYHPMGALVWLPTIHEFATFDHDHGVLRTFAGITWSEILSSPAKYVNGQWHPERVDNQLIRPWQGDRFLDIVPTKDPNW